MQRKPKTIIEKYLEKDKENFELYKFLSQNNKFLGWQGVSIFYASLCYVKAYLCAKGIDNEAIRTHQTIMEWLTMEEDAKRLMILDRFYNLLYCYSRDARYKCTTFSQAKVDKMLSYYEGIKKELIIPKM